MAAAERGWPYLRVLLTDVLAYPASHVLQLRRDATGGYGLTLPEMGVEHIAMAVEEEARVGSAEPAAAAEGAAVGGQ